MISTPSLVMAARKRSRNSGNGAHSQLPLGNLDDDLQDYLAKVRQFNKKHKDDIFLSEEKMKLLRSSVQRFKRLQSTVGHGRFYLLGFDDALKMARSYSARVGAFPKEEIAFIEEIFYETAAIYGFLGEKPLKNLTDEIPKRKVVKIPGTGNYLYRGEALKAYKKMRREVGSKLILTSGIRSVIKQFLLFLDKAVQNNGNLSLASRSLAPPGYSFHGVGDFDVGQVGLGPFNFTEKFVATDVFQQLRKRGFIQLRYPRDNQLGVRFEPWHIKVHT
ncbi:M15 family metallopeptidase [Magnetococcales bacterium HHB-1]